MKPYPRREFLLRALSACGTPFLAPALAQAAQGSQLPTGPDAGARAATIYFGTGIDAARAIGETYLRQLNADATRAAILEHTAGALQTFAGAQNQKAALAQFVSAVRRDFEEGRIVLLDGWIVSRTEAELCALTLLPPAAVAGRSPQPRELHI